MPNANRVVVLGSTGVLGGLVASAFEHAGWAVARAARRPGADALADLDRPETLPPAFGGADAIVNPIPHEAMSAELAALAGGALLINLSAVSIEHQRRLHSVTADARGTIVMNAGMAPGVTNVVAADLLARHPEADEVEVVFTASPAGTSGPTTGEFGPLHLRTVDRHATRTIPLPEPYGVRECVEFAEPQRAWLGAVAADREVHCYVCALEPEAHDGLLALNAHGAMTSLPRPERPARNAAPGEPSREPIAHWVGVLRDGERIAASTVQGRGDFVCTAEIALVFAEALLRHRAEGRLPAGVFDPDELLDLPELAPPLAAAGIEVVDATASARAAVAGGSPSR